MTTPLSPVRVRVAKRAVLSALDDSNATAHTLARQTGCQYRHVLAALQELKNQGRASWRASWYGLNDGYKIVWSLNV